MHIILGFSSFHAHVSPGHAKMDEDVRLDEDWLQATLLDFKERIGGIGDISLISFLCGWHRSVHLLPRVENIFNGAPPAWQHYYSWNEAQKWSQLWQMAFEAMSFSDCKVDKRPCDIQPASSLVTQTFTYFFVQPLSNSVLMYQTYRKTSYNQTESDIMSCALWIKLMHS